MMLSRRKFLQLLTAGTGTMAIGGFPRTASGAASQTASINVGHTQDLAYIDPARNVFLNELNNLWVNIYEMLPIRTLTGQFAPNLAESWKNSSPTEWVFKLRQGVTFHNGEPFNAEAVKFTVERYFEKGKERYGNIAFYLTGAEVIDPYTVKLITKAPDATFIERIWEMPILPPKYLKEVGDEGFIQKPVGTGPYRWVEWVKGSHFTLEANPNYWHGQPQIKRATFKLITEIATRMSALKAGEIDIALQVPPDLIDDLEHAGNLRISVAHTPRIIYFVFYPESPLGTGAPLADRRVRRAINHAVNIDNIIQFVMKGQAERVATLYGRNTFAWDPSIKPYEYNPQRAKQLLAEAGHPNGFPIRMDVPTGGNPIKPVEVAQAVAADLEKVGIKVQLRTLDTATYAQLKNPGRKTQVGEKKLAPIFMWNYLAIERVSQG